MAWLPCLPDSPVPSSHPGSQLESCPCDAFTDVLANGTYHASGTRLGARSATAGQQAPMWGGWAKGGAQGIQLPNTTCAEHGGKAPGDDMGTSLQPQGLGSAWHSWKATSLPMCPGMNKSRAKSRRRVRWDLLASQAILGVGGVGTDQRRESQRGQVQGPGRGPLAGEHLEGSPAWVSVSAPCPDFPEEFIHILLRCLLNLE